MKFLLIFLLLPFLAQSQSDLQRWKIKADRVTIKEDIYGVPHIYGEKDADAVFGLMYLQCTQNFERVERNYLEVFGRLAEVDGPNAIWNDLQMQMIYDTTAAKKDFERAPQWLKELCISFADGINYYLHTHPEVKPAVLKRFEPWFPLMYTDGSISATQLGGMTVRDTRELYDPSSKKSTGFQPLPFGEQGLSGSNGFAIAPKKSASGNAMLYINPHVTYYFRTEVQMSSKEGLNVYGAATWGNFFIYQGFNASCGWMHTSSYADVADIYREKISNDKNPNYEFEGKWLPLKAKNLILRFNREGKRDSVTIKAYYTHHGPVLGSREGSWLSLKERNRSLDALMQSWLRTKANSFKEFSEVMALRANNSNNTVYADREKNIAYWHGNFVPVRDTGFNWALPVDGTTKRTEWKGIHKAEEIISLRNPASGWIQNCNSTPFTAAGESSPKRAAYAEYMGPDGENGRAVNAVRLLSKAEKLTPAGLISIGYNTKLSAFDIILPPLLEALKSSSNSLSREQNEAYQYLLNWDLHSNTSSVATTIAIEWASRLMAKIPRAQTDREATNMIRSYTLAAALDKTVMLELFRESLEQLKKTYGDWKIAWGDINRFQRNPYSTNTGFSDTAWSIPSPLAPGAWGCLPSFNTRSTGTKKKYGVSGNSFVAVVDFGERLKAYTITTGGASFNPNSIHFTDQAEGFVLGRFKEVFFYEEDVNKNTVRTYKPGEE